MINPNTPPILPDDKKKILPSKIESLFPSEKVKSENLSSSPWAKMFPSGATHEQLKMFIQGFLKDLMAQIRHDDRRHKELMEKQKEDL